MANEQIAVEKRETRGTRCARRMRVGGRIPAVLYGHGEQTVSLSVPEVEFDNAIRRGARVVDLVGEVTESALVREVQFDPLGTDVLHVDFTRVRAGETAQINMRINLKGIAPGTKQGGVIEHLIHEVRIDCPVNAIPEKLELNINSLELGQSFTTADIPLPTGATLVEGIDGVVVQCVEPTVQEEEAAEGMGVVEPEVIGRKPEDEEGAADG